MRSGLVAPARRASSSMSAIGFAAIACAPGALVGMSVEVIVL